MGRFWLYLKILIIIILPLLISLLYLFPLFEKIELSRNTEVNKTIAFVSKEKILKPSLRNFIQDVFSTPFNLKWYHICFEDLGTYGEYSDGKTVYGKEMDWIWIVNFNNETDLIVPLNSYNCTLIEYDKKFTYNWIGIFNITIRTWSSERYWVDKLAGQIGPSFSINPNTTAYAKPERYSIIAKNFLFFISWISMSWLFSRIYKLVVWGVKKSPT